MSKRTQDRSLEYLLNGVFLGVGLTVLLSFLGVWLRSDTLIAVGGVMGFVGVLACLGTAVWVWGEFRD